jgi:hypothetical protein
MRRVLAAAALLLGLPLTVAACLWDSDTPESEARGMPEVVSVIAGRFARNPPLFYEMRLSRVSARLRDHPDELAAYDDAGVACDRLGRGDEAVAWMAKKREQLELRDRSRAAVLEQWYRYHANLGTFLAHRWARTGSDRAKLDEVKAARGEIARAIEINPDAHFGRESYQLRALDWIIHPPAVIPGQEFPTLLGAGRSSPMGPKEADKAVRGLAGLVVLGNAWESVDVFNALAVALHYDSVGFPESAEGGRNSLSDLAVLRCRELIDAGKGSMLPGAPSGKALKEELFYPGYVDRRELEVDFATLRADADSWHKARTAFMVERLKAGRHPDTDPGFWAGYREDPAPVLPTKPPGQRRPLGADYWISQFLSVVVLVFLPSFFLAWLAWRLLVRPLRARWWTHSKGLVGDVLD